MDKAREIASKILNEVHEEGAYANVALARHLRKAVEVGIEAVQNNRPAVVRESADLIYNLVVLWSELGITPGEIWREMDRREELYGIAEKLPKSRHGGHRMAATDGAAGDDGARQDALQPLLLHGKHG